MFLVVIDYASIVVFFMVLAGLLFLLTRPKPAKAEMKVQAQVQPSASSRVQNISYGLLAALFVLMLMVAILADRGGTPLQSRK